MLQFPFLAPSPSPATGETPRPRSFPHPKTSAPLQGLPEEMVCFENFISLFMEMSISGQNFSSLPGFPRHSAEQDPAPRAEDEP